MSYYNNVVKAVATVKEKLTRTDLAEMLEENQSELVGNYRPALTPEMEKALSKLSEDERLAVMDGLDDSFFCLLCLVAKDYLKS